MNFLRAITANAAAIAAVLLLLSATDGVQAQGKLSETKAIPKSCNNPKRMYVQRDYVGLTQFSNQQHEAWHLYAQQSPGNRFFLGYTLDDQPWFAKDEIYYNDGKYGFRPPTFYNRKKDDGGLGWIVASGQGSGMGDRCPGKAADPNSNQMTVWRCNKGGTYPNFYVVGKHVFFDVDGKTYRLYVEDTGKHLVRYEECK